MRTLGEVQAVRTVAIRNDHLYRMKLALRDEPDYSNDEPKPHVIERQPSSKEVRDDLHKTRVLINDLMSRVNKHIDASQRYAKKKYVSYNGEEGGTNI